MSHFALAIILSKWNMVQNIDHIASHQVCSIDVLVSQLEKGTHGVFSSFKILLFETILSVSYRPDQLNCFWEEWSKLSGWNEVAEFTEAVGKSVPHYIILRML